MVIKCYKKLSGIEEWNKDWNTYVTSNEFFSPGWIPGNIMKEVKFELYSLVVTSVVHGSS